MTKDTAPPSAGRHFWRARWFSALAVLVGGVLLHSMNVLMLATVLPSVVDIGGGATLISWTSTAYLASSIVAATCTGYLTSSIGPRNAFCIGAFVFGAGAFACAGAVDGADRRQAVRAGIRGRSVWRRSPPCCACNTFPGELWARAFALLSGHGACRSWSGPMVRGVFASTAVAGAFFNVAGRRSSIDPAPFSCLPGLPALVPRVSRACAWRWCAVAIGVVSSGAIAPTGLGELASSLSRLACSR